ncbi:hypothetical protein ACFWGI_36720 [Streptomyces niveus]|uniref:hypothetical protein n=1 Tax=Streptomyces niveus TaxID=193462 RepID=UPI00365C64D9
MAEEPETTIPTIQEMFAEWHADQLEKNRSKQATLKKEEEWLLKQLDAATEALSSPGSAENGEGPAPVPQQRHDIQAPVASKPAVKGKAASRKTKKKPEAKTPAKKTAAPRGGARKSPPLHELLLAMLLQNPREPRTNKEMHAQLAQDHPDRQTSINVVRNGLEHLVALSQAARSNQQGSVMYTATVSPGTDGTSGEAGAGGSDETASVETDEKAGAAV